MTDELMRAKIAEQCGFEVKLCPIHHSYECCGRKLPDYPNDLNACHQAEKYLDTAGDELQRYAGHLWLAMNGSDEAFVGTIHATARHRSEAFLRVKRLWEDP